MTQEPRNPTESPATLVAIIVAARRAGDHELERETRRRLQERCHVTLYFARELEDRKGAAGE
jgi:hypothetical protein